MACIDTHDLANSELNRIGFLVHEWQAYFHTGLGSGLWKCLAERRLYTCKR